MLTLRHRITGAPTEVERHITVVTPFYRATAHSATAPRRRSWRVHSGRTTFTRQLRRCPRFLVGLVEASFREHVTECGA